MQLDLRGRLFHSTHFCFCIPVRAGFVLISLLTFLLSGAVSVIIWFEVSHSSQLSAKERAAFILAGIVESFLFLASILGFIGVVARKQLFVTIYTYFLYVHFVLNLIVGIYFLVTLRASNRQELVDYCTEAFENNSGESVCSGLLRVSTYVFIAIVAVLLSFEFYGVLIATRYVYRLRKQKRNDRSRRLGYFHALSRPESLSSRHTRQTSDDVELLYSQDMDLDGGVLDIQPQTYMPVSTHDRDVPPPAPDTPLSTLRSGMSDTTSGRRIRALPPRPNAGSPVVSHASPRPKEDDVLPAKLPNPYGNEPAVHSSRGWEPEEDNEDERLYGTEVSSTAHSALLAHASYMQDTFSRPSLPLR